jgi:hypothetical protein
VRAASIARLLPLPSFPVSVIVTLVSVWPAKAGGRMYSSRSRRWPSPLSQTWTVVVLLMVFNGVCIVVVVVAYVHVPHQRLCDRCAVTAIKGDIEIRADAAPHRVEQGENRGDAGYAQRRPAGMASGTPPKFWLPVGNVLPLMMRKSLGPT